MRRKEMRKSGNNFCLCGLISLVMIVAMVSSDRAYADLKDGLVSVWKFDEGNGNVVHDSVGGNDGTIDGAEWVNGKYGMALDFDGVSDGVEIPDDPSLQLADALTVACWIYPRAILDAAGNDHAGIVWKGNMIGWGSDAYNWRIATASDMGLTWGSTGGGTEGYFATANCLVDGLDTWYHVALVENGSEGRAYVNGVEMTDADVTGGDMHRPRAPYDVWEGEPVRIGWSQGRDGDLNTLVFFDGIIDDVAIYDRALDANEIEELMENGTSGGRILPQPDGPEEPGVPSGSCVATWGAVKDSTLVHIEEQIVDIDKRFSVDVRVSNVKNLAGFQIDLHYDPYYLQFIGAREGKTLSQDGGTSFWRDPEIDTEAGTITGAASTRIETGGFDVDDGVLATFTFQAKELGLTMLFLEDVKLSDPNSNLIPLIFSSAFITISPPWDVIQDSVVDIRDMVAVGQNLSNSQLTALLTVQKGAGSVPDVDTYNPDADRNGVVNVDDLILVSSHLGENYKGSDVVQQSPIKQLREIYGMINAAHYNSPDIKKFKDHLNRVITMDRNQLPPVTYRLLANYPNPFNPDTWIPYQLSQASDVTISIYSASGELVRILDLGHKEPGAYISKERAVHWDGISSSGEKTASGVYFYVMRAGDFTATRKMIMEK